MREIKFRAFNTVTGKMIDLYKITPLALDANLKCDGLFIPYKEEYKIMQFTGLTDKNGKEIYEGDIVNITTTGIAWGKEYVWTGEVVFSRAAFVVKSKDGKRDKFTMFAPDRPIEVIGNRFENPELVNKL